MPETRASNMGAASHSGESQASRDSHFVYDYSRRRIPMPVIAYAAVSDAGADQKAGESASKKALDMLRDIIEPAVIGEEELISPHMEALVRDALAKVNQALFSLSEENPEQKVNVSVTFALADKKRAFIGHVGTNRIYLLRNDRLYDLTPTVPVSVSPATEEPSERLFSIPAVAESTPAQTQVSAAIGHYLGQSQAVAIGYNEVEIVPGDVMTMATDGFWKVVSEEEIVENLLSAINVQRSASQLIRLAFSRNATDNASLVTWQYVVPGQARGTSVKETRSAIRRERTVEALLVTLLALVLAGIFAVGFAFGWRVTDSFRKPQKEAARKASVAAEKKVEAQKKVEQSVPAQTQKAPPAEYSATVQGQGVRIRSASSTSGSTVAVLQKGQQVTVTGQETGSDGKTWLKVKATVRSAGKDTVVEGFVRNDFLERSTGQSVPGG